MIENYDGNMNYGGYNPQQNNGQMNGGQPNMNYGGYTGQPNNGQMNGGQPNMNYGGYNGQLNMNYGGYNPQPNNPQPKGKGDGRGLGIASMVLGIISLLLFCTCVNWITGIIAIILGIVQLVKHKEKAFAIMGIATAGLSLVLAICMYGSLWAATDGMDYEELYDSYYGSYYDDYDEDDYYYDEDGNRKFLDE